MQYCPNIYVPDCISWVYKLINPNLELLEIVYDVSQLLLISSQLEN